MYGRLLKDLAYTRSGDKGDVSNIGVLAFDRDAYDLLCRVLTPQRLKEHFGAMVHGPIDVYQMPNIDALQIVMRGALGGGATRTLRFDQTGKAMATALMRLEIPEDA